MDKKTPKPKIERRDGKIFVEGEKHAYMQGMIRHFYLSAKELCFNRSISHDFDKGVAHASFSLIGKTTVDKDSLGIIGNKKVQSRDLSLHLRPWPKDETPDPDEKKTEHKSIRDHHTAERKHGPWRGVVGFIEHDWEIGIPDEWFAEVYLPQPVFDELATVCRKGSLATLSLGFNSDFWVADYDEHAPPSVDITWYLAPGEYGSSDLAFLALDQFNWTENSLFLKPSRRSADDKISEEEVDVPTADPEAYRKQVEAKQLAIAERVRKTLYFIGAMLALVVVILALK